MSISYGQCETVNGAAANAAYNSAYQQAVAEGVSVFVAAGDSGAAGCDNSAAEATHGIGVNAFASTPNNVAVGGTDFSDTYTGTNATYWNSSNTSSFRVGYFLRSGNSLERFLRRSFNLELPWLPDLWSEQFVQRPNPRFTRHDAPLRAEADRANALAARQQRLVS